MTVTTLGMVVMLVVAAVVVAVFLPPKKLIIQARMEFEGKEGPSSIREEGGFILPFDHLERSLSVETLS